jgi:hypothetical protein
MSVFEGFVVHVLTRLTYSYSQESLGEEYFLWMENSRYSRFYEVWQALV